MSAKSISLKVLILLAIMALLPFYGAQPVTAETTADTTPPVITIWYGNTQNFGAPGVTQVYYNILGNVADPETGIQAIKYSLNGGAQVDMEIGPDFRRLVDSGDFNIDIHRSNLKTGSNSVVITAWNRDIVSATKTVTINYTPSGSYGLPYNINWGSVSSVTSVAQVTDGKWNITAEGVRTGQIGYDRMLAIGDITWGDYEVVVPVTLHAIDTSAYTRSGWGSPAIGIINHWQGHSDTPVVCGQPKCGWEPNGALNWYRFPENDIARLVITAKPTTTGDVSTGSLQMQVGGKYWLRAKVVNGAGGANTYYLKVWQDGITEPANWTLTKTTDAGNQSNGSLVLVGHFVDVTFGNVVVTGSGGGGPTYTLNVSVTGTGTVSKSPNKATYNSGEVVTLTANPGSGRIFAGWGGALSGSANPTTITMDSNKSVSASFVALADLVNGIYLPYIGR